MIHFSLLGTQFGILDSTHMRVSSLSLFGVFQIEKSLSPKAIKDFLAGMPQGYGSSVAGMMVFGVAGIGDLLWHTFLGIEGGTDILLSTTHLGLAAGLSLSLMAPFWAAWNTPGSGERALLVSCQYCLDLARHGLY